MADLELLENHDAFASMRNRIRALSKAVGEWAGIPMPIEGEELIVAPGQPFAELFARNEDADIQQPKNVFWCHRRRCNVLVFANDNGKSSFGILPGFHSLDHILKTIGASYAWGIEQESNAVQLLATLLRHNMFKSYLLTGTFLETSQRSGITYLFRRLRPTVAFSTRRNDVRILCALCMHPIAYYAGSWAGAMCPTDDVIAHLMLMRADEHMFWKRCNQHPASRPEAGI